MHNRQELTLQDYQSRAGQLLGVSEWIVVTQAMIDQFAEITGDRQFIHVDPVRARQSSFGSTIAHGFLTLSLISRMSFSAVPRIQGAQMGVNYGMNAVRFVSPVRAGARVRGRFTLKQCVERKPRHWQSALDVAVEIENVDKPALVAEWLNVAVV